MVFNQPQTRRTGSCSLAAIPLTCRLFHWIRPQPPATGTPPVRLTRLMSNLLQRRLRRSVCVRRLFHGRVCRFAERSGRWPGCGHLLAIFPGSERLRRHPPAGRGEEPRKLPGGKIQRKSGKLFPPVVVPARGTAAAAAGSRPGRWPSSVTGRTSQAEPGGSAGAGPAAASTSCGKWAAVLLPGLPDASGNTDSRFPGALKSRNGGLR